MNDNEINFLDFKNRESKLKLLYNIAKQITFNKLGQAHLKFLGKGSKGNAVTFGFGNRGAAFGPWGFFKACELYPEIFEQLKFFINDTLPVGFVYSGIYLNKNMLAKKHKDPGNKGDCLFFSFGDFEGGELKVYLDDNQTKLIPKEIPALFNGSKYFHETQSYEGERYALIAYKGVADAGKKVPSIEGKKIMMGQGNDWILVIDCISDRYLKNINKFKNNLMNLILYKWILNKRTLLIVRSLKQQKLYEKLGFQTKLIQNKFSYIYTLLPEGTNIVKMTNISKLNEDQEENFMNICNSYEFNKENQFKLIFEDIN